MQDLKSIIIIDDYAFVNGGAANVAISSSVYLADKTDFDIYYFASVGPICSEIKNANFKEIYCADETDVISNPSKIDASIKYLWNKKAQKTLSLFLEKFDPESTVVHVHTWSKSLSSSIYSALNKLRIKTIITLHDYFIDCPNGGYFNYKQSKVCELDPLSCKCILSNCDSRNYTNKVLRVLKQSIQNNQIFKRNSKISYIYISDFSKNQLQRRNANITDLYYVENPIDFKGREKSDCSKDGYFLYVGRLSEEKGIRLFCDVIMRLGVKAMVIGDGPLKSEIEDKYGSMIIFKGWLRKKELHSCFKQAKALIFSSLWYETFGLTVLEAMSNGIPCIVPNNCAASEFIDDRVNGLIYDSGDRNSLINTIKLLDDTELSVNISLNSYNNFNTIRFSMKSHAEKLIDVYKKVLLKN